MIKGNNSSNKIVKEKELFYGIGNFKVVGINIDFETLQEFGFQRTQPPVYEVETRNGLMKKVTFYAINEEFDIKLPIDFFISERERQAASGKFRILNNFGQSTYSDSVEDAKRIDWFRPEGARIAKEGEAELVDFLIKWLNVKNFVSKQEQLNDIQPDAAYVENWDALLDGDMSEIQKYLDEYPTNQVKCLVFVKDKKYMTILTQKFERSNVESLTNWKNYADKQAAAGYPIKGDHVVSNLVKYVPSFVSADPTEDDLFKDEVDSIDDIL